MFSEKNFVRKIAILHVIVFTCITILGVIVFNMISVEKNIIELVARLWIIGIVNIILVSIYYTPVYKRYYETYDADKLKIINYSKYTKTFNLFIFKLLHYPLMYFCLEALFYLIVSSIQLELKYPKNIDISVVVMGIFLLLSARFIDGLIKNNIIIRKSEREN